ncbi:unnamed protein product [Amaranthus hypochondriacus]
MDEIVNSALEEICSQGINGISISLLWPRLRNFVSSSGDLCPDVKRAVWSSLINVPGLQFKCKNGSEFDPKVKPFDEIENLGVRVFANEKLRRCFVGLYDVKASNITPSQQRVLERLALARENGVTQHQLSKELEIAPNSFFYVVKRLESWGLITRQSTIVRTKEASCGKEPKNSNPMHTNLIHLHRYALPLSSQQRLEITKENMNSEEKLGENQNDSGGDRLEECGQDDMLVNDFLPAIKAVCNRLEQAEGKVLVVSDIKRELGYRETRGHRAWRNILKRLKQAGLVDVFEAKVESKVEASTKSKRRKSGVQNKPVSCLRLLKQFSPKLFQQKISDCQDDNLVSEQTITSGNKVQSTDQLVELPLEQQIFDMIDKEGSKGLLGVDVCRRLGISSRMLENLSNTMVSRFGLHQAAENRKKGSAYRFWTRGNFCPDLPNPPSKGLSHDPDGHQSASAPVLDPPQNVNSQGPIADMVSLYSQKWIIDENEENKDAEKNLKHDSQQGSGSSQTCLGGSPGLADNVMNKVVPDSTGEVESTEAADNSPSSKPTKLKKRLRYPSLTRSQREIRILERLEEEKIVIKPELQRWLESFEKDKKTRMGSRTVTHCVKKLEQEGKCKLMVFSIPAVTNCGHHREIFVILHPSVKGSANELSDQVIDRLKSFEMKTRGAISLSKKNVPVPELIGIERIPPNANLDTQSTKSEVMRANGFVLAKMVRVKLLHRFLWDHVNNSATCNEVSSSSLTENGNHSRNPHSSCVLFGLDTAIKAMPFELFLQVVGSPLKWTNMIEKCKNGHLLSDFPDEEYRSLMNHRANGRLSWLINILRRLKLIRMVADECDIDAAKILHANLIYALELKPYIEEPPSMDFLLQGSGSFDCRQHLRHDFLLSTSEAVEKYWKTLEYFYAVADPKAAVLAFPGSVVSEVCLYRSWNTIRLMKAEQRAELLKRIKDQQGRRLGFQECGEIAKDLNLSLEQVLGVYYDNRQKSLNRIERDSDIQRQPCRKRKISLEDRPPKHPEANLPSESCEDGDIEKKHTCKQKIFWTEEADRQLLIQYTRQRAMQGARRGTDWSLISDLPAPPNACCRRVSFLKRDIMFRKSLMRLCNLLTQRYAQKLDRESNLIRNEFGQEFDSNCQRWDDFDDSKVKSAFQEVLTLKRIMKLDPTKRSESTAQGSHNPIIRSRELDDSSERQKTCSRRRSWRHRLPKKFIMHLKKRVSATKKINQSLASSCAVELFKLVFLSNSKVAELPNLLEKTLRCYSEHDLFSAFDYLRQKKILVGGGTGQPFFLSQNFLSAMSLSKFPANTGKRSTKFARWLSEKEKDLMEGKVDLPSDGQCGDVLHLFALVHSGELSILPVLPLEGVGEPEDSRGTKRIYDDHEIEDERASKKLKCHSSQDSEICSRREKGFPGLKVSLSRAAILRPRVVELSKDEETLNRKDDQFNPTVGEKVSCPLSSTNRVEEPPDFGSIVPATVISGESIWEATTKYLIHDLYKLNNQIHVQLHPELIKAVYASVKKTGDQGLKMSKISECLGMKSSIIAEHVVDALQSFGLVLRVNGYNCVHVVDGKYRTKYFLTSKPACSLGVASSSVPREETQMVEESENCETEANRIDDVESHATNSSGEGLPPSNAIHARKKLKGCSATNCTSTGGRKENRTFGNSTFQPILPWINGDGTINGIVHRGLTRRVLGIVCQNPGILEDNIVGQMEAVLNPQSCRTLLESMILNKHLIVRKMIQSTSSTPPALLENLFRTHFEKPKFVSRQHYFANPMRSSLL